MMTIDSDSSNTLMQLAALGYSFKDMALYLNIDESEFIANAEDTNSEIYRLILRGKLIKKVNPDIQLFLAAEGGNITAIQLLKKTEREHKFQELLKYSDEAEL